MESIIAAFLESWDFPSVTRDVTLLGNDCVSLGERFAAELELSRPDRARALLARAPNKPDPKFRNWLKREWSGTAFLLHSTHRVIDEECDCWRAQPLLTVALHSALCGKKTLINFCYNLRREFPEELAKYSSAARDTKFSIKFVEALEILTTSSAEVARGAERSPCLQNDALIHICEKFPLAEVEALVRKLWISLEERCISFVIERFGKEERLYVGGRSLLSWSIKSSNEYLVERLLGEIPSSFTARAEQTARVVRLFLELSEEMREVLQKMLPRCLED